MDGKIRDEAARIHPRLRKFTTSMRKGLLIGDVGSTKSTWWIGGAEPEEIRLSGYNPIQHADQSGLEVFRALASRVDGRTVRRIEYYGTGVAGPSQAGRIQEMLKGAFPDAGIRVHSDLLGAARAACGYDPGCVAILGTGSHAACYDGTAITRQATSLGYPLGDEGGGNDIGKALIRAYYYGWMPPAIAEAFQPHLPGDRVAFLQALGASGAPNQFLASFVPFAAENLSDTFVAALVGQRFEVFIRTHLLPLEPDGPIHIVGSVGCIFARLIARELRSAGLEPGQFLQDPARALFELHQKDGRE